ANTSNNSSTVTTTINCPDLTITKTGPASVNLGSSVTYTLTVHNIGTGPSFGTISVTDTLPAGMLSGVTASGVGWTCTGTTTVTSTSTTPIPAAGNSPPPTPTLTPPPS